MQNTNEKTNQKTTEKKEQYITKIIKLLQSATLTQLKELEIFIKSYLT